MRAAEEQAMIMIKLFTCITSFFFIIPTSFAQQLDTNHLVKEIILLVSDEGYSSVLNQPSHSDNLINRRTFNSVLAMNPGFVAGEAGSLYLNLFENHEPTEETFFNAFNTQYPTKNRSDEAFFVFIPSIPIDTCKSINQHCHYTYKNYLSISPVNSVDREAITDRAAQLADRQHLKVFVLEDPFLQRIAMLPEDEMASDAFLAFDTMNERESVTKNGVILINRTFLSQCKAIQNHCEFYQKSYRTITPLKSMEQSLLTKQLIDLDHAQQWDRKFFHKTSLQKIVILPNDFSDILRDAGFIFKPGTREQITTNVGRVQGKNMQKHVINFDGSDLIYYDQTQTLTPGSLTKKQSASQTKLKFVNEGKILINSTIGRTVLDNIINTSHIVEANHISMKSDHIVLDNKEDNHLKNKYLNNILHAINTRTPKSKQEESLLMDWKKIHHQL